MELTDATLALILEKLAAFFGTTVEAVQAQLPTLLDSYAKYSFVSGIGENLFLGIFISCIFGVALFGIGDLVFDEFSTGGGTPKWYIVTSIIIIIIALAAPSLIEYLKWQAWPEYYAVEAILKSFK